MNALHNLTAPARSRRIALLGFGTVGRAFIRQVVDSRDTLLARRGLVLDVVAIGDRSGVVGGAALSEALTDSLLRDVAGHKAGGGGLASHVLGTECDGAASIVPELPPDTILVDCTATEVVSPSLLAHLGLGLGREQGGDSGGAVVLANKLPLVGSIENFDAFEAAAAEGRAAWEATVGSGVPIIAALRRLIDADDQVTRIEGTFSGTLNFLAAELRQGRPFSEIVSEARARNFTEPDPRADLGGLDMARKALILARMLGRRLDLGDVEIEGLYPPAMDALDVEGFMAALPSLDAAVKNRVDAAASRGAVFRHVASVGEGGCSVGPVEVPADSPLGRLVGTDNLVTFRSRWYDPTPLVIQGRGAGVDATAAGVLADVVAIATGQGQGHAE